MKIQIIVLATFILLPLLFSLIILFADEPVNLRLPTHIIPELYNITIRPFMSSQDAELQYKFQGDVHIRIKPQIATKLLVMHAVNLNFTLLNYWPLDKPLTKKRLKNLRFDFKTERIIFDLRDILRANKTYNLHFQYTGHIHNESFAVFRNEYRNEQNESSWMIGTLMEPAAARHVFPCFDEPKFKAIFVINIIRPTHLQSYSNAKRICSYVMGNYTRDIFAPTPKMSTYLVAFVIGSFVERNNHNYGVLAQSAYINSTLYALEISQKLLIYFGNYFNITYHSMGINKLQLIAMLTINFTGMENWGLVIVQQSAIVYDKISSDFPHEAFVAKLIAHELGHMWFGNLVTCDWWSYLWLHEGFATYFMYKALPVLNNDSNFEWEIVFLLEKFQKSLMSQAKGDATALNIQINKVNRDELFSKMVYEKGAAFVRMVRHILGEDNFQKSLQLYLQTYKYKTAKPNDLFRIWLKFLPAPAKHNFLQFCKTYTDQPGYPLIIIIIGNHNQSLEIQQQRFLRNSNEKFKKTANIFNVPITFTTDAEMNFVQTQPTFYLADRQITLNFITKKPIKWLIANIQATGFYRVHYNTANWQQIGKALLAYNFSNIPTTNRLQLVDDIQNLFCADFVQKSEMLAFLKFLRHENHFGVWQTALTNFQSMLKYFTRSRKQFAEFTNYMENILSNIYEMLGFTNQTVEYGWTSSFREQIAEWSCKYGIENCLADCHFYMANAEAFAQLHENQKFLVYCTIVRHGNQTSYEQIFELYSKSEGSGSEQSVLLAKALGCIKDDKLLRKHFWNILNVMAKQQRQKALITFCSENFINSFKIYKLISENFEQVSDILGGNVKVAEQIEELSLYFTQDYQKQELQEFIKELERTKNQSVVSVLQKALESLNVWEVCLF